MVRVDTLLCFLLHAEFNLSHSLCFVNYLSYFFFFDFATILFFFPHTLSERVIILLFHLSDSFSFSVEYAE